MIYYKLFLHGVLESQEPEDAIRLHSTSTEPFMWSVALFDVSIKSYKALLEISEGNVRHVYYRPFLFLITPVSLKNNDHRNN